MRGASKISANAQKVFSILRSLPAGKATSYRALAQKAGLKSPRQVGPILRMNRDAEKVPCFKVVHSDGTLASGYKFGGPAEQARRLAADGVRIKHGRVDPRSLL